MNYYSIITFLLIGLLLFYVKLGWLGIIFIALAIISGFYNTTKTQTKSAWKEIKEAKGSYPEGKLKEYTENAIKLGTTEVTRGDETSYNYREIVSKAPKASKNFFSELKDLFK